MAVADAKCFRVFSLDLSVLLPCSEGAALRVCYAD